MRAPIEWLTDFVDIEMTSAELAHRLTMSGLKVEAIERIGEGWDDVVVGHIVELEPHPTSKKPLSVARVDLGDCEVTIVTGAPNVQTGQKVPVVPVGGLLPHGPDGGPMRIERRPMAGIDSEGMLASERELGISDEHAGIFVLPSDAEVGASLRSLIGGDVLDIETNPNRPDTLSIIGIAREIAALTQQQLSLPDLAAITGDVEQLDQDSIAVTIEAPELCPRYSALRIEGVRVQESPLWLAERLKAAGMRPINLLVDITNYVMLEYGQPMHAFDASSLRGDRIIVRRAEEGETIRTLDGVLRSLTASDLVIADAERAVGIAGVIGGEDSEIRDDTTSVILESANFDGYSVRRTAQSLPVRTESSSRFEKGLPPEGTVSGIQRYVQLLAQTSENPLRIARISDVAQPLPATPQVAMPMRDLHRLVGVPISEERAAEILSLLGFGVVEEAGALVADVPYWRRTDITQSADLVEEVIRIVGFDDVPTTLPLHTLAPPPLPRDLHWESVVRERLLAGGATEVVTNTLTSPQSMARLFAESRNGHDLNSPSTWEAVVPNLAGVRARGAETLPVHLINPSVQDRNVLRLTMLPSILDVVARNAKHTEECLAFFELHRTFFTRGDDLPYERRTLAVALSGNRRPVTWAEPSPGPYTFYDVKGLVTAVLESLQVPTWNIGRAGHPGLHPGRSAAVFLSGVPVGYLGELHPAVAAALEIEGWPVQVAEVDLDALFALASDHHQFSPVPRFPSARRDIAVVVDENVEAADVLRVIHGAAGDLLERARIFDVYQGKPLDEGRKSIAVGLDLREPGGTLTQERINSLMSAVVDSLGRELNAVLRE